MASAFLGKVVYASRCLPAFILDKLSLMSTDLEVRKRAYSKHLDCCITSLVALFTTSW